MSYVVSDEGGSVVVTAAALTELVVSAAEAVEGTQVRRGRRRLEVDVADGRANVRLELEAPYGVVLPRLARDVQERVAEALASMCGVEVEAVEVSVEAVA